MDAPARSGLRKGDARIAQPEGRIADPTEHLRRLNQVPPGIQCLQLIPQAVAQSSRDTCSSRGGASDSNLNSRANGCMLSALVGRLGDPSLKAAKIIPWSCPVPSFGDLSTSV